MNMSDIFLETVSFVIFFVVELDRRRNEQKAEEIAKKNGRQTCEIFAAFCFNSCPMVEFEEEKEEEDEEEGRSSSALMKTNAGYCLSFAKRLDKRGG